MESPIWKESTQNINWEKKAALTLSQFEKMPLKRYKRGYIYRL